MLKLPPSLLAVLVLLCLYSRGASNTDSLLHALHQYSDAERSLLLDSLTREFSMSLDPSGDTLFHFYLEDADGDNASRAARWSRYRLMQGNQTGALIALEKARAFKNQTSDLWEKRKFHYELSFIRELSDENEIALLEIDSAITFSEQLADSTSILFGECYKAKGRIFQSLGDFAQSARELNRAKEIFVAVSDSIGVSQVLLELGIVHAMIGLYDESEFYFLSRYEWLSHVPPNLPARDAINLGRNELNKGDVEAAYRRFLEAFQNVPYEDAMVWINPYVINGLIESAYFSNHKQEIPDAYALMVDSFAFLRDQSGFSFLYDQSEFFNELVKGNYTRAEELALSLYQGSIAKGDPSETMLHARFLTELYKQSEDNAKAIKYAEVYGAMRDSTLTANKTNALLLYQTEFETKEKENEIVRLANEKKIEEARSNTYLAIALGLLGVLIIGGILYRELRQARNTLKNQNTALAELNIAKNKFFRIIGHDLRNPIITFKALGNRIRRQRQSNDIEGVDESLELISQSANQVRDLLDNLLEWVLSQEGLWPHKPEVLNMPVLVKENQEIFQEMAREKNIKLSLDVATELKIKADVNAMRTILRNMLSNAIKYTPKGGSVELIGDSEGDMAWITVSDTGIGMDQTKIDALFDISVRATHGTEGEKGTGLGLPLVKELVALDKGRIDVKSEEGVGTQFTVIYAN